MTDHPPADRPRHPSRRRLLSGAAALMAVGAAAPALAQQQPRPGQRPANRPAAPSAQAPAPTPTTTASGYPWIDTPAQFALLIDHDTGTVLLDKNSSDRMYPSSMTKLMTAYIAFEMLARGDLKFEETFLVSENAWKKGGSKMFVELNGRIRIDDLLRGIIVVSGNDACVVLAEGVSGSEEKFAELMTQRARALGMTGTQFRNASGWPDPDHYTIARDLALLARRTIEDFPQYYTIYNEREYAHNNIKQPNRNPLLGRYSGADGLKTGHTEASGFGLTASAIRQGRRVNMVINGLNSMRLRQQESERLMDWAFREFENYVLFKPGDVVEQAPVWLGEAETVPLVAGGALAVTLPRRVRKDMKVTLSYPAPIAAPIKKGQVAAKLVVTAPTVGETMELPVVAGADVAKLSGFGRLKAVAEAKILGTRP